MQDSAPESAQWAQLSVSDRGTDFFLVRIQQDSAVIFLIEHTYRNEEQSEVPAGRKDSTKGQRADSAVQNCCRPAVLNVTLQ